VIIGQSGEIIVGSQMVDNIVRWWRLRGGCCEWVLGDNSTVRVRGMMTHVCVLGRAWGEIIGRVRVRGMMSHVGWFGR
jgi:hypothetical protein